LIHVITNEMRNRQPVRAAEDAEPFDPAEDRPAAVSRLPRKLTRALPAAFAQFRRVVRSPLSQAQAKVGAEVVLPRRYERGRIEELIMGLHSGATTYAVRDPFLPDNWLLLVPSDALIDNGDSLELLDATHTVAVPRELALAA
jgi:hypothetical protein